MTTQARFALQRRNPDVLTCIANLSNDEVFTPPALANAMLDVLTEGWAAEHDGADLWADETLRFLDPCTKSGVFLREITTRLTVGLASKIPNLQERVNHILTKQVFGIGITHLTSLLARRSVYCSKHAQGEHSVARGFGKDEGNVWFERREHEWVDGKCSHCGASQEIVGRGAEYETHAYAFIHTRDVPADLTKMFGEEMTFDVIIGNPPYQLNTPGFGNQARPIYHHFVQQAKALEPRFLVMVIPARWFSGGMGLDEFRASMLNDNRLRVLEDFPDSGEVFPGPQIKGGVCYFLWSRDSRGPVRVRTHNKGNAGQAIVRPLLEPGADVFIRYNEALPILRKIIVRETGQSDSLELPEGCQFSRLVSSIGAFGLDSTFRGNAKESPGDLKVYRNGGVGYTSREAVPKGHSVFDQWKVFIPRAGSGSDSFPHPILGRPFLGEPGSVSSWTYMYIGPFRDKGEAQNVISYISTRLFRFLVLLHKPTQDATKSVYTFVPVLDFSRPWDDGTLRERYGITDEEWSFVTGLIRPFEPTSPPDEVGG